MPPPSTVAVNGIFATAAFPAVNEIWTALTASGSVQPPASMDREETVYENVVGVGDGDDPDPVLVEFEIVDEGGSDVVELEPVEIVDGEREPGLELYQTGQEEDTEAGAEIGGETGGEVAPVGPVGPVDEAEVGSEVVMVVLFSLMFGIP
jgi:hypothetical protein